MSSHREAPAISQDPVADNADVYAFVSPDDPTRSRSSANYVPLQGPPGGPNFFEFGDDVLYSIYIDNDGDALPDITYQFRFQTTLQNPDTFLYNTGPITSLDRPELEQAPALRRLGHPRRSRARSSITRTTARARCSAQNLACPPCNIGPRSTPNYDDLAAAAVHHLPSGETVFAGQRNDGVLRRPRRRSSTSATLRPFQNLHLIPIGDGDRASTR